MRFHIALIILGSLLVMGSVAILAAMPVADGPIVPGRGVHTIPAPTPFRGGVP